MKKQIIPSGTSAVGGKEKIVLEEVKDNGGIKYWRDSDGTHHVPKRKLDDIII